MSGKTESKKITGFHLLMLGLAVAVAGLSFGIWRATHPSEQVHGARITVLSPSDFIPAKEGPPTPEDVSRGLREMKKRAQELASQGWIVLDESAVLAWPEDQR